VTKSPIDTVCCARVIAAIKWLITDCEEPDSFLSWCCVVKECRELVDAGVRTVWKSRTKVAPQSRVEDHHVRWKRGMFQMPSQHVIVKCCRRGS
jgi:hypothetical protein